MFYVGRKVGELYGIHDTSDGSMELCSVNQIKSYLRAGLSISGVVKVGRDVKITAGTGDFNADLGRRKLLGDVLYGSGFRGIQSDIGIRLIGINEEIFCKLYKRTNDFRPVFIPEGVTDIASEFWTELGNLSSKLLSGKRLDMRELHFPSTLRKLDYEGAGHFNPNLYFNSKLPILSSSRRYYLDRDVHVTGADSARFVSRLFASVRGLYLNGVPLEDGDLSDTSFCMLYAHNSSEVSLTNLNIKDSGAYIVISGNCDLIKTDDTVCVATVMHDRNIECKYPIALESMTRLPSVNHFGNSDGALFLISDEFSTSSQYSDVDYYDGQGELSNKLYEITKSNKRRVTYATRKEIAERESRGYY